MRTIISIGVLFLSVILVQQLFAQEDYKTEIEKLKSQREQIAVQEREALKQEVESINDRMDKGLISVEEARILKENAAEKRALNIEDRTAIIDNKIALLERNEGHVLETDKEYDVFEDGVGITVNVGDEPWDPFKSKTKAPKYDRRTYSDFVIAFGLNNAIIEGQSLNDSPYRTWGSKFFEIGWAWRTRVFNNSNFMRFHYGFSFQFNGLKSEDDLFLAVNDDGQVEQQPFGQNLDKSKFRMDNLVIPVHFEFGPSRKTETENMIRYSIRDQFRIGLGGYGGVSIGHRQKLKYEENGDNVKEKLKRGLDVNSFVYGLSAYMGVDCVLLYVKYDLQPIFNDSVLEQQNISFGLRFDM